MIAFHLAEAAIGSQQSIQPTLHWTMPRVPHAGVEWSGIGVECGWKGVGSELSGIDLEWDWSVEGLDWSGRLEWSGIGMNWIILKWGIKV